MRKRVVFTTVGGGNNVRIREYIPGVARRVESVVPFAQAVRLQKELSAEGYRRTVISNKHIQYEKEQ